MLKSMNLKITNFNKFYNINNNTTTKYYYYTKNNANNR